MRRAATSPSASFASPPVSSARQTVLESAITVTPAPAARRSHRGPFGEEALSVTIDAPHRVLTIEARARVEVHAQAAPSLFGSPSWEAVRAFAYASADLGPDGPATYLYPTQRTPLDGQITDYARTSFPEGRPILEAASDLMRRIQADFAYDPRATDVSTPAAQAFAARRGVCQDFAHVMISGLRGLGLPAAYVSGYLRTIPPPGKPRLQGADATHAWAAVWCGDDLGWIGFDPTNGVLAQNDHIVLATGRDYADVPPIEGVILTPGAQTLTVEVDVIPER